MSKPGTTQPNLFIVGKHKAGTVALASLLSQHPDVFFPLPLELEMHHLESDLQLERLTSHRVVTDHLRSKYNVRRSDYLRHYSGAGEFAVRGDRSPSYIYSKTSAAEIYDFNPDARIIAIFREPASFLYSLHSQNLFNLYEDEPDFLKALALEEQRKNGLQVPHAGRHVPYMLYYSEHLKFAEQLQRFLRWFPPQNIRVLFYEDFRRRNVEVARELFSFLGIDNTFSPVAQVANPNKIRRSPRLKRITRVAALTGIPQRVIPRRIYQFAANWYKRSSTEFAPRVELDPTIKTTLRARFAHEVDALDRLLADVDIARGVSARALWKYEDER